MVDIDLIIKKALDMGFTVVSKLDCSTIKLLPEVRDMCSSNKCNMYNKNWSCPLGCGTLDECKENVKKYKEGIIVQTVGELEDSMDFENMERIAQKHNKIFIKFSDEIKDEYDNILALGSGACTKCNRCTYPDSSCKFPKKIISSMEAYGMIVSQICIDNNVKYYYGINTLAYTGCFLI